MTSVSMAFFVHCAERSLFVAAGLLCLWLGYRLLVTTIEFLQKLSEHAANNTQSAIDTLKSTVDEAGRTLEQISKAETKVRRANTDLTQLITQIANSTLDNIPEIRAATDDARSRVQGQLTLELKSVTTWRTNVTSDLAEISNRIVKMETSIPEIVPKGLNYRLRLGWWSSGIFAILGVLLLLFAAFGMFPTPKFVSRDIFGHRAGHSRQSANVTTTTTGKTVP